MTTKNYFLFLLAGREPDNVSHPEHAGENITCGVITSNADVKPVRPYKDDDNDRED